MTLIAIQFLNVHGFWPLLMVSLSKPSQSISENTTEHKVQFNNELLAIALNT